MLAAARKGRDPETGETMPLRNSATETSNGPVAPIAAIRSFNYIRVGPIVFLNSPKLPAVIVDRASPTAWKTTNCSARIVAAALNWGNKIALLQIATIVWSFVSNTSASEMSPHQRASKRRHGDQCQQAIDLLGATITTKRIGNKTHDILGANAPTPPIAAQHRFAVDFKDSWQAFLESPTILVISRSPARTAQERRHGLSRQRLYARGFNAGHDEMQYRPARGAGRNRAAIAARFSLGGSG